MSNVKLLFVLPLYLCCFCSTKQPVDFLCGDFAICWDASAGFGHFMCRDGKMCEYVYDDDGSKTAYDYGGDIIVGQLNWKLRGQRIDIFAGQTKMKSFFIKELTEDRLVFIDSSEVKAVKEVVYTKANNQTRPSSNHHAECGCKPVTNL